MSNLFSFRSQGFTVNISRSYFYVTGYLYFPCITVIAWLKWQSKGNLLSQGKNSYKLDWTNSTLINVANISLRSNQNALTPSDNFHNIVRWYITYYLKYNFWIYSTQYMNYIKFIEMAYIQIIWYESLICLDKFRTLYELTVLSWQLVVQAERGWFYAKKEVGNIE